MNAKALIKIGYNPDFAPFSYQKDGQAAGVVIDRIRDIFSQAEIECEFIATDLMELKQGLMDEKFDLLAALAKTGERTKIFSFTKPVIVSGGAWFVPRKFYPVTEDDVPKAVVTPKVGPLVEQIRNLYPEIKIITCDDYDEALEMVQEGGWNINAAALNWHVGRMMIEEKYKSLYHVPKSPFNTMPLSMAAKSDDPSNIIGRLNGHIPEDWGFRGLSKSHIF